MSGWIKIGDEFIKSLSGQWKCGSHPDAPSDPVPFPRKSCCNRSEGPEVIPRGFPSLGGRNATRDFINVIAGMAVSWPIASHAQIYPSRPITMVIPFAAGGAFDVMGESLRPV